MTNLLTSLKDAGTGLLGETEVTVETTVLPPFTVGLAPSGSSGWLVQALRPRLTVSADGHTLATMSPYGDPSEVRPFVMVGIIGVFALLFLWVLR